MARPKYPWHVLHISEVPELRLLERRLPDRLVLLSFCTTSDRFVQYTEYPGVVYNLHFGYEMVKEARMKFIKSSLQKARSADVPMACGDTKLSKDCPALFEFLTCSKNDDGSERKTSTMTVFYDQGSFKVFLNDRDSQMSLCVTSPTLSGLWDALDDAITSDDPGWRPIRQPSAPKRPGASQKKT